MTTGKYLYIVIGSEDGIQGIASNKKKVWEMVVNYLMVPEDQLTADNPKNMGGERYTYAKMCKEEREQDFILTNICRPDGVSVRIEEFRLNAVTGLKNF